MLEILRSASKTWVAAILIGMLIISFAVWGINDIFTSGSANAIAHVGDEDIDVRTFETEYQNRVRRQTDASGQPMTAEEGRRLGLDRMVLQQMILDLAVRLEAQDKGITASDDMVREAIASIPGLTGIDGSIDPAIFARLLQSVQMDEADFVRLVRQDLMRAQLLQTARVSGLPPAGMVRMLEAYANERRVVEYVVLPPEKAGEIPAADDAALQAYIQANAARYTTPELRAVTLLAVGPEQLKANITVADDEVKALYETQKARFEILEKRELQQISFPSKDAAEAARKALDGGKTFEQLAADQQLKPEDITLGTIDKGDASVPAAAFEIPEGQVTQPVEGPFGWVLIKAVKVTPGSTTPYEEAAKTLRDEIAQQKALDEVSALAARMQEVLPATDQLEDVAKELNLTVRAIPAMDAEGRDADGKPIEGLPDGPTFLKDTFELEQGDKSFLGETPEHVLYVVRVDTIAPPALRKLDTMRDSIAAAWLLEQQAAKLKALAEATATKAAQGPMTAEAVAAALQLSAKTSAALGRNVADEDLSPELLTRLFATPQGTWVSGMATTAPRMVVARVKEVTSEAPADAAQQRRSIGVALNQAISGDLADTYAQAILAATKVEINEAMFERTRQPR